MGFLIILTVDPKPNISNDFEATCHVLHTNPFVYGQLMARKTLAQTPVDTSMLHLPCLLLSELGRLIECQSRPQRVVDQHDYHVYGPTTTKSDHEHQETTKRRACPETTRRPPRPRKDYPETV